MTNKKRVLVGSFAAVIAAGAIGVSVTSAHFGPRCQNHAAIEDAIKNNNFKAFNAAIDDGCFIADKINTKKEFNAMAIAYDLRHDGKYKQARQVLEDVGIEHPGRKIMRYKKNADMRDALRNNNWTEFQQVSEGKEIANIINTEDKFNLFAEAHALHRDGRHAEAHEIMKDLGIKEYHK